jgi:hypothetical protein
MQTILLSARKNELIATEPWTSSASIAVEIESTSVTTDQAAREQVIGEIVDRIAERYGIALDALSRE